MADFLNWLDSWVGVEIMSMVVVLVCLISMVWLSGYAAGVRELEKIKKQLYDILFDARTSLNLKMRVARQILWGADDDE